ncbi:hypothetical protein [Streptomyces antarcticus]|uniref:hypothetical protein n=1 Tax=Streptomyces antarcticus TaxID=2996458 RepID=UPI002270B0CD|nr:MULTISPECIES: hypothetical protein [unclassified Streptomyces]MCY0943881.1 hypothetical protein [Streptomyces sp. H34-AA3]MCZ4086185.1 hypothetical protein [Streptomyces sp. H34-S5]
MHAPRKHRRRIAAITTAAAATAALSLVSAAVFLGTPLDVTGAGAGAGTGGRVAVEAPARLTVDGVSGPGSPAGTGRGETFGRPLP